MRPVGGDERLGLAYLDSWRGDVPKFTRVGRRFAQWPQLLVGVSWVALGAEYARLGQRSAWFSVSSSAVIGKRHARGGQRSRFRYRGERTRTAPGLTVADLGTDRPITSPRAPSHVRRSHQKPRP